MEKAQESQGHREVQGQNKEIPVNKLVFLFKIFNIFLETAKCKLRKMQSQGHRNVKVRN